jgi:Uma2 family endonuclease
MTLAIDQIPLAPRVKRWTKDEYTKLVKLGVFRDQRVYLFRGEIIEMSPQLKPHAYAVMQLTHALFRIFGTDSGYLIRIQLPFDAPGDTMPEPDALVCTAEQNRPDPHPKEALLVVEVSDTSLQSDRDKAAEYAAAQVSEYWIIDTGYRRVEVYRGPVADPTAPLRFRYPVPTIVDRTGVIEPLSRPGSSIPVAQFFYD